MNWITRLCQSKPMATPFEKPYDFSEEDDDGLSWIDSRMSNETAEKERKRRKNIMYLGRGSYNAIGEYEEDKKYVVKYTSNDHGDVEVAEYFMAHPIPCIVPIISVEMIQESPPVWAIAMEKVQTLRGIEFRIVHSLNGLHSYISEVAQITDAKIQELQRYYFNEGSVVRDYVYMCKCIYSHGWDGKDAHGKNVGYLNGKMVLFDLGGLNRR